MKDIEFRVYDKKEEVYSKIVTLDMTQKTVWLENENNEWAQSFKNVIFEQYIGLLDKNKKKIFEGDIIKYTSFENNIYHLKVGYSEEDARFLTGGIRSDYAACMGEVVGDIHHDVKLLS